MSTVEMDSKDRNTNMNGSGYALSGRIMMSAIVALFFIVVLMVCLHLYARWYLLRVRRRQLRNRRGHLVFHVDPANPNSANVTVAKRGLDDAVLKSLPLFVYSAETHKGLAECAVCLSEFEEKEMGRTLPKCGHSFHVGCIDMWFYSHSTCPLCRSVVERASQCPIQVASSSSSSSSSSSEITEVDPTHDDLCPSCQHEEDHTGPSTSSFGGRRKPVGLIDVTIEVPTRQLNFQNESATESPASQSFRSPVYRMLSFTRILGREIREVLSPSAASSGGCGVAAPAEMDIEQGETRRQLG